MPTLHLIDANVVMTANNTFYPINRVPEFWAWLLHLAEAGHLKMPLEIFSEITDTGGDERKRLHDWAQHARGNSVQPPRGGPGEMSVHSGPEWG